MVYYYFIDLNYNALETIYYLFMLCLQMLNGGFKSYTGLNRMALDC